MILIPIFILKINNTFFPTTKLYMTCTLDDKQYLVVIEKEKKVTCASCEETMLQEINEKYLVEDDIYLTEMNIESYFVNNSGVCE